MYTVREAMKELGVDIRKTIGAFQGFGNVSQYADPAIHKQYGGTPICVSCWTRRTRPPTPTCRTSGIDPDELVAMTDKFGTVDKEKAQERPVMRSSRAMPGSSRRPTSWCQRPSRTK